MEHGPSKYQASVPLTYYHMWELSKAINARISDWISKGELTARGEEIASLMEVNALLEKHIARAVEEWEDNVAKSEAQELNDENKMKDFLSDD